MAENDKQPTHDEQAKHGTKLYEVFRDYVKHEDGLINNRTTWLMTVQSFLIATFGFSYQKKFELLGKGLLDTTSLDTTFQQLVLQFNIYLIGLAAVGFFTCKIGLASIDAAVAEISKLDSEWKTLLADTPHLRNLKFPLLTGGGSKEASENGIKLADSLPRFFKHFWAIVLWLSPLVVLHDWTLSGSGPIMTKPAAANAEPASGPAKVR